MDKFDVVVVGARCAGSTLAMQLARQGLRVCVAEKTGALGDKPSTHLFTASGTAVLERLGVLDDVLAAGATRLRTMQFRINDATVASHMDTEILGTTLGIRREVLDNVLVEHAARAGADVRLGCPVDSVLTDEGRVVGVATSSGPVYADLVIGADGMHSTVSKAVGAEEYLTIPGNYIPMWSFFEGANPKFDLIFGVMNGCNIVAPRLDNGIYNVQLGFPMSSADAVLADRHTNFDNALSMCPELVNAVLGATRVGPVRMYRRWHGYFRTPVGPGWALLGDAGHFKDPALGQGMADAFRHSEQLASGIVRGLGGGDIDHELLDWWRWRDADAFEMHFASHFLGDAELAYTWLNALGRTLLTRPDTVERILQMISLRNIKPRHALGRNMSRMTAYITPRLIVDVSQIKPTMKSLNVHLSRIARLAAAYPGHPLGARRYRRLHALPEEAATPESTALPGSPPRREPTTVKAKQLVRWALVAIAVIAVIALVAIAVEAFKLHSSAHDGNHTSSNADEIRAEATKIGGVVLPPSASVVKAEMHEDPQRGKDGWKCLTDQGFNGYTGRKAALQRHDTTAPHSSSSNSSTPETCYLRSPEAWRPESAGPGPCLRNAQPSR